MANHRSFRTTFRDCDEPDWAPLEALSRLVRSRTDLPHFHPGEFMWMYSVESTYKRVVIHLYKHYDTRHYLNLDLAGIAYEFRYNPLTDADDLDEPPEFGGRYRRFASLEEALVRAGLREFDEIGLCRSFPPSEWPADEAAADAL